MSIADCPICASECHMDIVLMNSFSIERIVCNNKDCSYGPITERLHNFIYNELQKRTATHQKKIEAMLRLIKAMDVEIKGLKALNHQHLPV